MLNITKRLVFQPEDRNTSIEVKIEDETVWMTQKAIAELYQSSRILVSI